jgi:hypothetical protein
MNEIQYTCIDGHWQRGCEPVATFTWRDVAKWVLQFVAIFLIALTLAWLFIQGWDKQHAIDTQKTEAYISGLLYDYHQDRSVPQIFSTGRSTTTGFGYYERRTQRGK